MFCWPWQGKRRTQCYNRVQMSEPDAWALTGVKQGLMQFILSFSGYFWLFFYLFPRLQQKLCYILHALHSFACVHLLRSISSTTFSTKTSFLLARCDCFLWYLHCCVLWSQCIIEVLFFLHCSTECKTRANMSITLLSLQSNLFCISLYFYSSLVK